MFLAIETLAWQMASTMVITMCVWQVKNCFCLNPFSYPTLAAKLYYANVLQWWPRWYYKHQLKSYHSLIVWFYLQKIRIQVNVVVIGKWNFAMTNDINDGYYYVHAFGQVKIVSAWILSHTLRLQPSYFMTMFCCDFHVDITTGLFFRPFSTTKVAGKLEFLEILLEFRYYLLEFFKITCLLTHVVGWIS